LPRIFGEKLNPAWSAAWASAWREFTIIRTIFMNAGTKTVSTLHEHGYPAGDEGYFIKIRYITTTLLTLSTVQKYLKYPKPVFAKADTTDVQAEQYT